MNNDIEDIIIIEEGESQQEIQQTQDDAHAKSAKDKKKLLLGATALIIIILGVAGFFIYKKLHAQKNGSKPLAVQQDATQEKQEPIEPSNLENMIAKANYLYSKGSKNEALAIYENIATYSEAISAYNLGVAQLNESSYELAISNFKRAIDNNENKCVSALNAAVCSLHLNNMESFNHYIDLANAYLPMESKSPLYSYYYTLINFYKSNYYEVLNSTNNSTTSEYSHEQSKIAAKINTLFDNNKKAIEVLEKENPAINSFSLGLLYARDGNLELAKERLKSSIKSNIESAKSQVAISLIDIKLGNIKEAAKEIDNANDIFGENIYLSYPIKVVLKESIFNTEAAQNNYRQHVALSPLINYQKIFYFSPYKVFNANQVVEQINKGSATVDSENAKDAKEYLQKGLKTSISNRGIVEAIQKALDFKIREANEILQKIAAEQPKHSILQYNLALTYAQLGNMADAYKHFLRSYNLDAKNYLSGIYAIITAKLTDKDATKLTAIINDSLNQEPNTKEIELYKTLFHISQNDYIAVADYLYKDDLNDPLRITLDAIIAQKLNILDIAQKQTEKLTALLPNEILPHIMYIDAHFAELKQKEYASSVLNYLKLQKFNYKDLYFGPFITRYLYTQQNLITGKLYQLREELKKAQIEVKYTPNEITASLALASLYDGAYEEAFTLYNSMIDEQKITDASTLFLASVASIAANHHDNAIALLELSKIRESSFLESRYALGLLYLEAKNNKGATSQFEKFTNSGFSSQYFDFDIDTNKLLFEKNSNQLAK